MAQLTVNKPASTAETTIVSEDPSTGPHTFNYNPQKQFLVFQNEEGAGVTVNILGDGVTTIDPAGLEPIDISGGFDWEVGSGTTETLYTLQRSAYCGANGNNVTVTITGATSASKIWLSEY